MVFPVIMYGCESWTIKKTENWRTDAFELWCWRRLLRLPWTSRRSNQFILKEISPEYSLEGPMLKLKLKTKKLKNTQEDSWVFLELQGHPTNPYKRKSVLNIHWKKWFWSWSSNIWPPDVKNWLIGKDPDAGKDWRQEEKRTTEDEMVGWHHWLNGQDFEQALGETCT